MGAVGAGGSLTLQRVRQRSSGAGEEPAEYAPAVAGEAWLGVPLPLEVRGEADVELAGRQYCVHPDQTELLALDPSARAGIALERGWRLPRAGVASDLVARIAVDNVADAAVYDQCGLPRPGRTLRLELRIR